MSLRDSDKAAETALALRYIGESYDTEDSINLRIIAEYITESDNVFDTIEEEEARKRAEKEAQKQAEKEAQKQAEKEAQKQAEKEARKQAMKKTQEQAEKDAPLKSQEIEEPMLKNCVSLNFTDKVSEPRIEDLLKHAVKVHYCAFISNMIDYDIFLTCVTLFKFDYECKVMANELGSVCWNYPANIPIPVDKSLGPGSCEVDSRTEVPGFRKNFERYGIMAEDSALVNRRRRFPVPVILYNGKFICRSGTLAIRKGAVNETMKNASKQLEPWVHGSMTEAITGSVYKKVRTSYRSRMKTSDDKIEQMTIDSSILDLLKITYICDLMIEDRKTVTRVTRRTSSSDAVKVSKYGKFRLMSVPYPSYEFFKCYREIRSDPEYEQLKSRLIVNWSQPDVAKAPDVPGVKTETLPFPELNWVSYRSWSLETLTKNYLRLMLYYFDKGDGGILIHCISGWDRTPLFICLLRVSLWADNLIHKTLDVAEMAYFTLGYDWYLFGHDLPTRQFNKQEIMHFCFKFLPCISSKEFSINHEQSTAEKFLEQRRDRIEKLSKMVLNIFDRDIAEIEKESSAFEIPMEVE